MTSPTEPPDGPEERPVDLGKRNPSSPDPNDPYRFGLPDRLPPPEYAPPGWVPPGGWPTPGMPPFPGTPPGGHQPAAYGPPPGYPPPGYPPPHDPYRYGAPPPGYSPYPARQPGRGKAVAALVLGILSIVMFVLAFLDGLLVLAAVVFGVIALNQRPSGSGSPRGMAIAGLVCAAIGALLATIWTVFLLHAFSQCGGLAQSGHPAFRACVQRQIG